MEQGKQSVEKYMVNSMVKKFQDHVGVLTSQVFEAGAKIELLTEMNDQKDVKIAEQEVQLNEALEKVDKLEAELKKLKTKKSKK